MEDTEQKKLPATFTVPSYIMSDDELLELLNKISEIAHQSDTGWTDTDRDSVCSIVRVLAGPRGRIVDRVVSIGEARPDRFLFAN